VLARAESLLPRIPQGDIAVAIDGAVRRAGALSGAFVRLDGALREWPVASALLVVIVVAFAAALAGSR
jgi:hypothetical protein